MPETSLHVLSPGDRPASHRLHSNRLVAYPGYQLRSPIDTTGFSDLTVKNARLTRSQYIEMPFRRDVVAGGGVFDTEAYGGIEGLIRS